jgi:hypothetical protein
MEALNVKSIRDHGTAREERLLDLPGQLHFVGEPLALQHLSPGFLQLRGHVVDGFGEHRELCPILERDRRV